MKKKLLEFKDLYVNFPVEGGVVNAIRGVSYDVAQGEVLGVVGESGSGKSVSSLAAIGLLPKSAQITGEVLVAGQNVIGLTEKEMSSVRGSGIAMIFQDPLTALNPVYTIGWQIIEAIQAHRSLTDEEAKTEAVRLLTLAGIPRAERRLDSYPHEFSGGMRQRVVIAIAMANRPQIILADEPTTALDVTVQAQVLETLKTALHETGASLVLITHDLGVIAGIADRVVVMYAGRIVETGTAEDIFYRPAMPYTHGLLGSIPSVDGNGGERLHQIPGNPPTMVGEYKGCPFAARCPMRKDVCLEIEPDLVEVGRGDDGEAHAAACHFAKDVVNLPIASMFGHDEVLEVL